MPVNTAATPKPQQATPQEMANALRALSMDAVQKANSGHPGMPMGMADVATVLFTRFLKFDPSLPEWPDRDRFVLSGGHGSMLLYSLLHLTGYEKMTLEQIKNFRQMGSLTAGHPEVNPAAGIETTTGPLGQGLGNAAGFALAERLLNARFGGELVDHYTYAMCGDGDLMEGISHEAASLAGHLGLGRLIVLYDDNGISIDGPTSLSFTDDTRKRFEAYGWETFDVDGHDQDAVAEAIAHAQLNHKQPSLICCKTKIGFGAPTKEGKSSSHGSPLGDAEIAGARKNLHWPYPPFEVPEHIVNAWRDAGKRGAAARKNWQVRLDRSGKRDAFTHGQRGDVTAQVGSLIKEFKTKVKKEAPTVATRKASGMVLETLAAHMPELIGGSADLTGSNLTQVKGMNGVTQDDFGGSYVYYGVREHAMAAMMNGMALHRGIIPYGGTFLSFTDYCRPSIRLSALMKQRVVYVMTHDSIGLGEDGPTHQPVEHLAALRAIPNVLVMRPADAVETAECWQIALEHVTGPCILALTRQNLPLLRKESGDENPTRRGAYILAEAEGELKATIWATGSEVEIALGARALLQKEKIGTRVISAPCLELFDRQDAAYRETLAGGKVTAAIEAAARYGWDKYIGPESEKGGGIFIGMKSFGESAPAEELYRHFGITASAAAAAIKERL
ncbi:MAG: transketolase [Alphaproteobacteria bacterium]|nr:transketolase [Alphaproteobacteria bacterium]MDE2336922.1 transketolase [Alphaproteobacteria bacterium]